VANRCDRLPAAIEVFDEGHGVLIGAQKVGVDLAAGNDECIVFVDLDRIDGAIDRDRIGPIAVLPAPDLSGLERNDIDLAPASSTLCLGTISSDCSKPLAARIATLLPSMSFMGTTSWL
jgi:hypothetical protein